MRVASWKTLTVAAVLTGSIGGGLLAVNLAGAGADSSSAQVAVESVVTEANNLFQNQGAPAPQGVTSAQWALAADAPLAGNVAAMTAGMSATATQQSLAAIDDSHGLATGEHVWVTNGQLHLLSASDAGDIITQQTADAAQVFAPGPLLQRLEGAISHFATEEETDPNYISSPGGARVIQWESVNIDQNNAVVQCVVLQWKQVDLASNSSSGTSSLNIGVSASEANEYATLTRNSSGQWQVVTLDPTPIGPTG